MKTDGEQCDLATALEVLARTLAPAIARAVVDELRAGQGADFYDQSSSPLGVRRHCAAIRAGKLPGTKVGRRWLAKRSDVERYMADLAAKPTREPSREEQLAAELGLRVVTGGRKARGV